MTKELRHFHLYDDRNRAEFERLKWERKRKDLECSHQVIHFFLGYVRRPVAMNRTETFDDPVVVFEHLPMTDSDLMDIGQNRVERMSRPISRQDPGQVNQAVKDSFCSWKRIDYSMFFHVGLHLLLL